MSRTLRIGTRDSELAVWQATLVQGLLKENGVVSELVYIKSEGDIDTVTPLYALGVTGVFTKTLDAALLTKRIDIAVHSMKDVPVQLAEGIQQAAVLKRGSHKDIFVPHPDLSAVSAFLGEGASDAGEPTNGIIATSSIRRISQWRERYLHHKIENLRGNVNTRLRKLKESNWHGAIFAAAGLERINLRPQNAIDLDWMLPAPAQGAIMVVCRKDDPAALNSCMKFNDEETALCTKIERDFLSRLMGGCSTPISALAEIKDGEVIFKGHIADPDNIHGSIHKTGNMPVAEALNMGTELAASLLSDSPAREIIKNFRKKGLSTNGEV
jgi:hydroxymethylbilane synthase